MSFGVSSGVTGEGLGRREIIVLFLFKRVGWIDAEVVEEHNLPYLLCL